VVHLDAEARLKRPARTHDRLGGERLEDTRAKLAHAIPLWRVHVARRVRRRSKARCHATRVSDRRGSRRSPRHVCGKIAGRAPQF